jgi:prepilin-type processing-associated H-X9-DG protein
LSDNLLHEWTNWEFLGYAQVGYAQTFPGTASYSQYGNWKFQTNLNYKLGATSITIPSGVVNPPSLTLPISIASRPQVACEMDTATDPPPAVITPSFLNGCNWNGPIGQYSYATSHMDNATTPAGVNIGMLDGHVEWRPFSSINIQPRAGDATAPVYFY